MSNISRRQFLKGAGVAALAVAAAGVLAGCSAEEVLTKDVKVIYVVKGAIASGIEQPYIKVAQDKTTVKVSEIPSKYFPVGYKVLSTGELKIKKIGGEDSILVILEEIEVPVKVVFYQVVDGKEIDIKYVEEYKLYASQKTISKKLADELAGDWCTVVGKGPFTINWSKNEVRIEAKRN